MLKVSHKIITKINFFRDFEIGGAVSCKAKFFKRGRSPIIKYSKMILQNKKKRKLLMNFLSALECQRNYSKTKDKNKSQCLLT